MRWRCRAKIRVVLRAQAVLTSTQPRCDASRNRPRNVASHTAEQGIATVDKTERQHLNRDNPIKANSRSIWLLAKPVKQVYKIAKHTLLTRAVKRVGMALNRRMPTQLYTRRSSSASSQSAIVRPQRRTRCLSSFESCKSAVTTSGPRKLARGV